MLFNPQESHLHPTPLASIGKVTAISNDDSALSRAFLKNGGFENVVGRNGMHENTASIGREPDTPFPDRQLPTAAASLPQAAAAATAVAAAISVFPGPGPLPIVQPRGRSVPLKLDDAPEEETPSEESPAAGEPAAGEPAAGEPPAATEPAPAPPPAAPTSTTVPPADDGTIGFKSIPLHHWALLVAVLAVALTCVISLSLIIRHLTNYGAPAARPPARRAAPLRLVPLH